VRLPGKDGLALFDEIRGAWPTLPVILLTAHGTIPDAVDATSRGVFGYLTKPFDSQYCWKRSTRRCNSRRRAAPRVPPPRSPARVRRSLAGGHRLPQFSRMAELMAEARMVAASDASVLIRGESGTGKEVLARAIHRASPRAKGPFVAINCGAIPEQLLESELFGHVKGAFTGAATPAHGLFQAANGGTLFLDEIGDMPLALQVKLLRVLQERAVRPVGATRAEPVDVRVLSATHRDLEAAMAEGQFREDLYYRLDVVTLTCRAWKSGARTSRCWPTISSSRSPPVRQDDPRLRAGSAGSAGHAAWPGNVRQLYNVVEQSCA
jgi:two-component system response regulator GlrR